MEILCRVPIKTLAASKSVCKSWLHLIRDPHFSQLHQARSPTEVCLHCFDTKDDTIKLHLGNLNFLPSFGPCNVKFNALFELPKFNVRPNYELDQRSIFGNLPFANSCNGLFCFGLDTFVVVCNPCTSEFITFPPPNMVKGVSNCRGIGFGFSTKAKKYKLLRVMGRKDLAEGVLAEICTIEEACSWKTVGPCPSDVWLKYEDKLYATFLQGTLHWVSYSGSCKSDITIHTFDFEDDKFGSVPPPFGKTNSSSWQERIGVLAGCLSMTCMTSEGTVIWLMKKYGVQDSWTKLFCLGTIVDQWRVCRWCLPLTYMDDGEILMTCPTTSVIFYNPVLKSSRVGRVINSTPSSLRMIAFRPSLVLLKDSMLGYKVHVKPLPRCADSKQGKMSTTLDGLEPLKETSQQHGSVAVVEEKREGHVGAISKLSATMLAHQQGTEAPTTGTGGESHGCISGMGLVQISTSAADLALRQGSKTLVTTDETCVPATKSMMEEVLEELRKEREQRQELEEQTEQLKRQNQELEERLQDKHAEVEQLKERIQQSEQLKQEDIQMVMQMMDEMRARLMGSR